MKTAGFVRTLVLIGASVLLSWSFISCSTMHRTTPPPAPSQKKVDPKAQRHFYDLGLHHYSKEEYPEAHEAFQKVIDISPSTSLGLRAKDNLKKIDQILKTLKEMRSK